MAQSARGGPPGGGPRVREIPEGDNRLRLVCPDCGFINYENPKIVVGAVVTWQDKFLLCRRAINPRKGHWTIPAGFLELHESVMDGARREAVEEARVTLGALCKVAEYYPSPGALSEYLYSYVALCDLPDGSAGVFGVADEAEDIKGHLVPFDALMALVASGEIANAPLILSALWLQRERATLRARGSD
ncbi:MAG: NUDIX domain-containing protein [Tabrizicola sp.]|nr:NUDIX domain-containing protein [Tabrizicola sp.]